MDLRGLIVCLLLSLAAATKVKQCPGRSDEGLQNKVDLQPCKKIPCRLRRGTSENITINFTPDHDLANLKNRVNALIGGITVPFLGVDGNSVCAKIYNENGEKAKCPLKSGKNYQYRDSFPVLIIYPTVSTTVQWALKSDDTLVSCFEVPIIIV